MGSGPEYAGGTYRRRRRGIDGIGALEPTNPDADGGVDGTIPSTLLDSFVRAYRIAYDGTSYSGFQRQPDVPTVEDAILDALEDLSVLDPAGENDGIRPVPERYAAAGRTDAGVSALAQTIAFVAPVWLTPRAFNAELPADVRAWAVAEAPESFHATHDATRREYTYHLYAPTSAEGVESGVPGASTTVDDDRIDAALATLTGTHDVHNLTPDDRNTERTLSLSTTRDGAYLVLTASAGGFSRELVRRLVSLVRAVGTGDASLETIDRVLAAEPLPGHEGIAPAAPEPLVLADVAYPDLAFRVDEDGAASARAVFERRRIERGTGARVSRQLRDGMCE